LALSRLLQVIKIRRNATEKKIQAKKATLQVAFFSKFEKGSGLLRVKFI
jgi:hypothetical protein